MKSQDQAIIQRALYLLSYIADGDSKAVKALVDQGAVGDIKRQLLSTIPYTRLEALSVLAAITSDQVTFQAVVQDNGVSVILNLLEEGL